MKTLFVVVALLTSPKEQAVVFNHLYSSCDVAIYKLKQKHDFNWYVCITEYHWRKWHQNKTSGEWLQWFNG